MSLITLDEIKSYDGMTGSNAEVDDELDNIAERISKIFETYCGRVFDSATYTECYDGEGSNCIYLKHYPITSVSGIYDDGEWGWEESYLVDSNNYRIKDERAVVLKESYTFYDYIQNVKIVYTAGYSTIPADLKHVCIIETLRSFKSRKEPSVISKSLADGTVSYVAKEFLPQTKIVLDRYMYKGII